MTEAIAYTHRFVASSETGRKLARAGVVHAHRKPSLWVVYLLFLALFTLIFLTGMDPRFGLGARVFWAVVFALVPTLILAVFLSAVAYVRLLRSARVRLFDGAVLESGFGNDAVVLRNPVSEARISYRGIKSLSTRGDFVVLQQHGVPMVSLYPRELFPDEAVARISAAHDA